MTLSINLPNLHYDKQMFKYPTLERERERRRAEKRRGIHNVILSRICTMSTRSPLKQVQNGQTVQIHALHPLCNFLLHRNNKKRQLKPGARCIPQTAQRNHVAARCCFPPPRSMIQGCQTQELGILSVRNPKKKKKTPGEQVWIDRSCRMSFKPYSSLRFQESWRKSESYLCAIFPK